MANHRMDGAQVRRGDTVHDVVYGAGTVTHLYPEGRGTVSFGLLNGATKTFHFETGTTGTSATRTLFWSQPFIVPPPKERGKYNAFMQVAEALAKLVVR